MQKYRTFTRVAFLAVVGLFLLAACSPEPVVPAEYTVAVEVAGSGSGSVTSSPAGIDVSSGEVPASAAFDEGTVVTLTATPDTGSTFVGWGGDCSGTGSCVVTLDADVSVTATFSLPPETFTVTVTTSGRDGDVTSIPAGIDLDLGVNTLTVTEGDTVTLTATPGPGNEFFGWTSGGCTGSDPCELTVTADVTVNALFFDPVLDVTTSVVQIDASSDDAVEFQTFLDADYPEGSVYTESKRVGLGWDSTRGPVVAGLRFVGAGIPQGALVTEASVTFTPLGGTEHNLGSPTYDFKGHAADAAGTFVYDPVNPGNFDISSRPTTTSVVNWVPDAWAGATATTNGLARVVQELVDRTGWDVTSPIVLIITSDDSDIDNRRRAVAWDTDPVQAPLLTVKYLTSIP